MADYRRYTNHAMRKKKETRKVVEVYKRRPIIKSVIPYKEMDDHIRFQVPIHNSNFAYNSDWPKGYKIKYNSCSSLEDARKYIDHLPEIMRKARLRKKISKIEKKINEIFNNIIEEHSNHKHLNTTFSELYKYPREDEMGTEINDKGKVIGSFLVRKGRSFNLSKDEQKAVHRAIFSPCGASPEDIIFSINNLKEFNQDVSRNLDILSTCFNEYITSYLKTTRQYVKTLKAVHEMIVEKKSYIDAHGVDTRENVTIPKGYKKMTENHYCWEGYLGNDCLVVHNNDDTIEIVFFLGKGLGGYDGEVCYKMDAKESRYYSIGSRGISSAFYTNPNHPSTIPEIIIKQGEIARKRQDRIRRSVDLQLGSRTWKVTPERVTEIAEKLKAGKSETFLPSGMGIGVIIANSDKNLPYNLSKYYAGEAAEKLLGMPVYAQDFEYD